MKFKVGDLVRIKCDAGPGPFDEQAVTIKTNSGVISGFVKPNLVERRGAEAFVLGKLVKVDGDMVEVQIPGSFFTSARGLTSVPREWADSNMERA